MRRPFDTEKEPNRGKLSHENAQIEHVEPIEVGIDWPVRSEPWKMLLGVAKAENRNEEEHRVQSRSRTEGQTTKVPKIVWWRRRNER